MTDDAGSPMERREAEHHLRWLHPQGPWTLTAIPPGGGKTASQTFFDTSAALGWAESQNQMAGVYVSVARLRGSVASKASKADVEAVDCLWVDIDPPKGMKVEDMEGWRDGIAARARAFVPPPSRIASSGGGVHVYWRLDRAMAGDSPAEMAAVEACNRWLARELGGDKACVNVDRILRLWGSRNRKPGRPSSLAAVIFESDAVHPISAFQQVEPSVATRAAGAPAPARARLPDVLPDLDVEALRLSPAMLALIATGDNPDEPGRYPSRSEASFAVTCAMVRADYDDATIGALLMDRDLPIADHTREKGRAYVERQITRAREEVANAQLDPSGRRVLDPGAPFKTATRLRAELFPDAIHTNDDWLEYERGAYRAVEDATMRSAVWQTLDAAVVRTETKKGAVTFEPFKVSMGQVSAVLDALKGVAHQPAERMAPPVWLDGDGRPPLEIVSLRNGLLHVPSGELLPPTPRFFTRNALDLAFDPGAPEPVAWLEFVAGIFPDAAAAALLQEWFGYFLLPDTSQEKMLLLVGPPRSGKGTIQKVLTELVGRGNVCAPSIKSLGGNFGLQPMIGKQVAFLSDIRIGRGSDREAITETLLRITGRDDVTADRKNKEAWTGRLAVRFFIATNEMPTLSDNSPALANRFVPLILEQSFLGKEDPGLADRLVTELPGILNWSLAGWRRLQERGRFVLPNASEEAIAELLELGSPVAAFIRDTCVVEPGRQVRKDVLYGAWQRWCEANKLVPGRVEHFARSLRAATSHRVDSARPSIGGQRTYVFEGIALIEGPY